MRRVCFIPSTECLIIRDLSFWIQRFEEISGELPTDVVLPATTDYGMAFASDFQDPDLGAPLALWRREAESLLTDVNVWAWLPLTLGSLADDLNSVRDQWNNPLGRVCLRNPRVAPLLSALLTDLKESGVQGVALDVTDIYPNSSNSVFPAFQQGNRIFRPLQNVCFCPYCVAALRNEGKWRHGPEPFKGLSNNIARLVLKCEDGSTGATPIGDIHTTWLTHSDALTLEQYAKVRGFIAVSEEASEDAAQLMQYLQARTKVTASGIQRISHSATDCGLRTSVILGSANYDLSQNVTLDSLLAVKAADEYWAPDFAPENINDHEGPELLWFLWSRASYILPPLFRGLAERDRTAEGLRESQERGRSIPDRNTFTRAHCAQLKLYSEQNGTGLGGPAGYVGIPMSRDDFMGLVDRRMREAPESVTDSDTVY